MYLLVVLCLWPGGRLISAVNFNRRRLLGPRRPSSREDVYLIKDIIVGTLVVAYIAALIYVVVIAGREQTNK